MALVTDGSDIEQPTTPCLAIIAVRKKCLVLQQGLFLFATTTACPVCMNTRDRKLAIVCIVILASIAVIDTKLTAEIENG
jgi:hypothetical protein